MLFLCSLNVLLNIGPNQQQWKLCNVLLLSVFQCVVGPIISYCVAASKLGRSSRALHVLMGTWAAMHHAVSAHHAGRGSSLDVCCQCGQTGGSEIMRCLETFVLLCVLPCPFTCPLSSSSAISLFLGPILFLSPNLGVIHRRVVAHHHPHLMLTPPSSLHGPPPLSSPWQCC